MKLRKLHHSVFSVVLVIVAGLFANTAGAAGIIFVETVMDLGLDAGNTGPDSAGLDGARLTLNTSYDTSGLYGSHGGFGGGDSYAGVASLSQSLTVSGATNSASNGVYNLASPVYFFPAGRSFAVPGSAGFGVESGADDIFVFLGSGVGIFFGVTAPVTPSGALADPNDPILQSDFEVTGLQSFRNVSLDTTLYELDAASQTVVPEPASAVVFGVAVLGVSLVRRRR